MAQEQEGIKRALFAGLMGAVTVTAINETARRCISSAPHLEELGMRGIAKALRKADINPPPRRALFWITLAADLASNGLYYSLVGSGKRVSGRGALLGLTAGMGAAWLPAPLGLGRGPTERSPVTRVMAVLWYLSGGLAAAATREVASRGEDG